LNLFFIQRRKQYHQPDDNSSKAEAQRHLLSFKILFALFICLTHAVPNNLLAIVTTFLTVFFLCTYNPECHNTYDESTIKHQKHSVVDIKEKVISLRNTLSVVASYIQYTISPHISFKLIVKYTKIFIICD